LRLARDPIGGDSDEEGANGERLGWREYIANYMYIPEISSF
jgi:hypothetical protein